MKHTIIIIIAIIVLILLAYYIYRCARTNKKQVSHFMPIVKQTNVSENKPCYAIESDKYNKPFILEDFVNQDLCKQIINRSANHLIDSEIIGGKHKNIRNSQQHWISKNDPLVKPLFETISTMFNIPFENAEDLQVVRYQPNQYFNEHHDSCCDDNDKCIQFIKRGGQRMLTVLIYLNNEFTEGQTYFPKLNLKIKPKTGSAIVFYPLAAGSSKCHPNALHAGLPVKSGEKWVANLWFREGAFAS